MDGIITIHNGSLPIPGNQISYSRRPIIGMVEVEYLWIHRPTDRAGVQTLWVWKLMDALMLLDFWSGGDWRYIA